MQSALILLVTAVTAAILISPRIANHPFWRATVTPLASIIGSGFLILGPILYDAYGAFAPLVMALLCLGAFLFGSAIRSNIAAIDSGKPRSRPEERLDSLASATLAFAYIISVAYYLNLFGAFAVSLTPVDSTFFARLVTSAVFAVILFVGWTRGFDALERMEEISVGLKLAVIAGLLFGLGRYFASETLTDGLSLNPPQKTGWAAITLGFGLIVTVQGFETSRYLGETYDARTRIRSMRWAQYLSALIYMAYIGFLSYIELPLHDLSETAIIDMMKIVAPVLPVLLVGAALSAQFSAAVADTSGSGGLVEELSRSRISIRQGYAILVGLGLALTWSLSVFQIVSYASRAFAVYYALQSVIAALSAWRGDVRRWRAPFFAALALLGFTIAIFGTAIE